MKSYKNTFCTGDDITYTLELKINADTGVVITKKNNRDNNSENDNITNGEGNPIPKSNILEQQFSFQNSMEFRCITQAELDILKWENRLCIKTCNYVIS